MTVLVSQCMFCQHFDESVREQNLCKAFPEGIPQEVMLNQVDHRHPVAGDEGVRWKPRKKGNRHPMKKED